MILKDSAENIAQRCERLKHTFRVMTERYQVPAEKIAERVIAETTARKVITDPAYRKPIFSKRRTLRRSQLLG